MYTIYNPKLKFALFDMKLLPFCLLILLKLLIKTEAPHEIYVFLGASVFTLENLVRDCLMLLQKKQIVNILCGYISHCIQRRLTLPPTPTSPNGTKPIK